MPRMAFRVTELRETAHRGIACDCRSQLLQKGETQPGEDTLQSEGESQGGLLLFKLNSSAYADRPLTLFILSRGGRKLGSITLDL